jgi:hypothetical protein
MKEEADKNGHEKVIGSKLSQETKYESKIIILPQSTFSKRIF